MHTQNFRGSFLLHHARNRGFTLIEVVIAVFMLSVAITFAAGFALVLRSTGDVKDQDIALRAANEKLDDLRAAGYVNLGTGGPFSNPTLARLPSAEASTTIEDYNDGIKQATVGVLWQERENKTGYVSLTTLVTETGGL